MYIYIYINAVLHVQQKQCVCRHFQGYLGKWVANQRFLERGVKPFPNSSLNFSACCASFGYIFATRSLVFFAANGQSQQEARGNPRAYTGLRGNPFSSMYLNIFFSLQLKTICSILHFPEWCISTFSLFALRQLSYFRTPSMSRTFSCWLLTNFIIGRSFSRSVHQRRRGLGQNPPNDFRYSSKDF